MQWIRKIPYLIIFLTLLGCTTMKIENFAETKPEFNLMQFFEGEVKAWGIIEDRFGNLRRQFTVDMKGTVENGVLTLEEDFIYADGEKDKRIWKFSKLDSNSYKGLANDIVGEAQSTVERLYISVSLVGCTKWLLVSFKFLLKGLHGKILGPLY